LILGIETSFNDTGAAVVRGNGDVLSNKVSTFAENYRGEAAPLRAAEFHMEQLPNLVE
jgi:tRNA A37 threonylcarbamoyltransferase TsaD